MASHPLMAKVKDLQGEAALSRKRGDALRKSKSEGDALASFREGVASLDRALEILQSQTWNRLDQFGHGKPLPEDQLAIARELVETWGARGGLLRRQDEAVEALYSYQEGSHIEELFVPTSTYNRTNALKFALLSGQRTLAELWGDIRGLEQSLAKQLAEHHELGDQGWLWADLADCRALLGDLDGAERAYQAFIATAETKAPQTTLDVLRSVAQKLEEQGDPGAANVRESVRSLERRLGRR